MSRWFRIHNELLDNYACQKLSGDVFKQKFIAAMRGEKNEFSRFVEIDRQSGRPNKSLWAAIRDRIFKRDDYTCGYCGARGGKLECDHKHPVSKGGTNDETNLITACFKCNRAKHARTEEEWKKVRGMM